MVVPRLSYKNKRYLQVGNKVKKKLINMFEPIKKNCCFQTEETKTPT